MQLYYSPGACSLAAHIMLKEWNIPHTLIKVDLKNHQIQNKEDYYKINAKGYVPALILENGEILTENVAILSYLMDQKSNIKDRYRFLEWIGFISTELHKSIGSLFGYTNGPAEVVHAIKTKTAKRLRLIDEHLLGKEFIYNNAFSAADAYLVTILNWCPKLQVDLAPFAHINIYQKKMLERPSIVKAMKEEGLI